MHIFLTADRLCIQCHITLTLDAPTFSCRKSSYISCISQRILAHLPSGGVPAEVGKVGLEPVVDLVEAELPLRRVEDRLPDEGRVRERRPHVGHPVELPVLGNA